MDWYTASILLIFGVGTLMVLGLLSRRRPWWRVALGVALLLGITGLSLGHDCVWEGLADGPLPVECRSTVAGPGGNR